MNNFKNILVHVVIWIIAFYIFAIMNILQVEGLHILPESNLSKALIMSFIPSCIAGIIIGIILGLVDILFNKRVKRKLSFGFWIFYKSICYMIVISIIHLLIFYSIHSQGVISTMSPSYLLTSLLIYSCVISVFISFVDQVRRAFGHDVLSAMFLGKYFNPMEENRIFMFLDLKSSTTIAEKLGHIKYSRMIQDCFYDLNTIAEKHDAEIYQYIGDEAVITWKIRQHFKSSSVISLYYDFKELLISRSDYYLTNYNIVPEFKTGINCGLVTAAEVGDINRAIAFHGDVLNTAARIQGECNKYSRSLLISENFNNILELPINFNKQEIGVVELKGKEQMVKIYCIQKNHLSKAE